MSKAKEKTCWYIAGLHFECQKCGACCSGPDEGYIWVTRPEIEKIAKLLKIPIGELRRKYLIRVGFRTTIIEQ
jgi:Fe-S-cluster containining protein